MKNTCTREPATPNLEIVPLAFRPACDFIARLHRHNKPPVGMKFAIGINADGVLVGVLVASRPVARSLDDGRTLEISRTCTDGTRNANSMLYGAGRKAAVAMGYRKLVTYTQSDETGASLRAAGFRRDAELAPRASWAQSTLDPKLRALRDPVGNGGVARVRWVWP